MLKDLELATFEPHVDSIFKVQTQEGVTIDLELIEAVALDPKGSCKDEEGEGRKPFSLLFRGPKGVHFGQQIIAVEHHDFGKMEIFLVPVRPDKEGPCYEAIFA